MDKVHEIALRWMPQNTFDDKSTLVQVMAWWYQASGHYLSQCWPRSVSLYAFTRAQWVNWSLDMSKIMSTIYCEAVLKTNTDSPGNCGIVVWWEQNFSAKKKIVPFFSVQKHCSYWYPGIVRWWSICRQTIKIWLCVIPSIIIRGETNDTQHIQSRFVSWYRKIDKDTYCFCIIYSYYSKYI